MEVLAVEGSFASVIGGAPAAAVVFTGEVNARTGADTRVPSAEAAVAGAGDDDERARCAPSWPSVTEAVRFEKLGEVAAEFDADPQRRAGACRSARSTGSSPPQPCARS